MNDRVIDKIVLKAKLQGASRPRHLHQFSALHCSRLDMHLKQTTLRNQRLLRSERLTFFTCSGVPVRPTMRGWKSCRSRSANWKSMTQYVRKVSVKGGLIRCLAIIVDHGGLVPLRVHTWTISFLFAKRGSSLLSWWTKKPSLSR